MSGGLALQTRPGDGALRVGVLGVGNMGRNHLRVLSGMSECELIGCYDANASAAAEQAERYQIKAFTSAEELYAAVDVAHIVVPSFLHRDFAVAAAKAGCHVLVEKPIALEPEDADAIILACEDANVRLCVGHVERFNPAIVALQDVLQKEELIALNFQRMSPFVGRISDATVVEDLMIHDLDVLNSLVASPVRSVAAHGSKVFTNKLDYATCIIEFENNVIATLTASRVTEAKIRKAEISAKSSFIAVDYLNRTVDVSRKTNFTLDVGYTVQYRQENIIEKIMVPMTEPLRAEFEHFYSCITTGAEIATNGESSRNALLLCDRIQKAIEVGRMSDEG
jgi:predicted dehydrogenase